MADSENASQPSILDRVTVVIPVYNGAATIRQVVLGVRDAASAWKAECDLVLVNDGSHDASWTVLRSLCEEFPSIKSINLTRNFGQHAALLCGIGHATGSIVVTMDDDLQHPPGEIVRLLDSIREGHDVVYGVPAEEKHGFYRDVASVLSKFIFQALLGMKNARDTSAFRALRSEIVAPFKNYSPPFIDLDAILSWTARDFYSVTVEHNERAHGQSSYTFRKLLRHALNMILSYTTLPLRIASIVGFFFTSIGLVVLLFVLGRYFLQGKSVPGFAFLACSIALFSGAQLFALGLLGEYFAKMHFRIMGRPGAVEREIITSATPR